MKTHDMVKVANNGEILEVICLKEKTPTLKHWVIFSIQEIKSVFNGGFSFKGIKARSPKGKIQQAIVNSIKSHTYLQYGVITID